MVPGEAGRGEVQTRAGALQPELCVCPKLLGQLGDPSPVRWPCSALLRPATALGSCLQRRAALGGSRILSLSCTPHQKPPEARRKCATYSIMFIFGAQRIVRSKFNLMGICFTIHICFSKNVAPAILVIQKQTIYNV